MSRATIEMNFSKAKQQASELEQVAKELKNLASDKMENSLSTISGSWESENATAYLTKARTVQEKISKCGTELQSTATAIRNIAQITYDAEMRALELAQTRKV